MSEKDPQRIIPMDDDVTSFAADEARLRTFREAGEQLSRFQVPRLVDVGNPHERIFYAFFDGTGNDADKDPIHATNVARFRDQARMQSRADSQVGFHYLAGVGTQDSPLTKAADGALGHTYEARMGEMYLHLAEEAKKWRDADPDVQVRVVGVGFSRGAAQAAIFTNAVHELGIVDLDSRIVDVDGRISYTRHIAAPGMTPQAVGLFDPVSTGVQELADRRLAPSVVSGFQITSLDEQRVKFRSDQTMPPGLSEDGRFLNVGTAGVHANIGGGYLRDGLSLRSFNLMADYLNAQRPGAPMFEKVHEPDDPRLNRVHNSHEGMPIYQLDRKVDRSLPEGVNTRLGPQSPVIAGQVHSMDMSIGGPKPFGEQFPRGPYAPVHIAPMPVENAHAAQNITRIGAAEAAGIGPATGGQRLIRLAGQAGAVLGAGATAYDGYQTAQRYGALSGQGNLAGAQSELNHAVARNVGGWAGGVAATSVVGASGFVPVAVAVVGADAMLVSKAFEKGADLIDHHKIYHQTDKAGVDWAFTGREWVREARIALANDPSQRTGESGIGASYEKSRELNAYANAKAVELALGRLPAPQDPFKLPASEGEARLDNPDWRYNAETDRWSRSVKIGLRGADDTGVYETQVATPERKTALDEQAVGVIQHNIANGRQAIAQTYLENAAAQRAQDFTPVPAAVRSVQAQANSITGSDNQLYRPGADGDWVGPHGRAEGNMALELGLTQRVREPLLEANAQRLAQLQAAPAPTAEQRHTFEQLHRYQVAGVDLNVNPETRQAIDLAVQRTRAAHGISGLTIEQLQRNENGQFGYDSPIVHYQTGPDGVARQVAITTSAQIHEARQEILHGREPRPQALAAVSVAAPRPEPFQEAEAASALAPSASNAAPAVNTPAPQPASPGPSQPEAPEPQAAKVSFRDAGHPGNATYKELLTQVHRMEFDRKLPSGPHSEQIAAALLVESAAGRLYLNKVRMGEDGMIEGIRQIGMEEPRVLARIDPAKATHPSMQAYEDKLHTVLNTPAVGTAQAMPRTPAQAQGIAMMSMNDQILFAHIRRAAPGHVSDDHVAQAMLGAKENQIHSAGNVSAVMLAGNQLWVVGNGQGQRGMSDVSTQALPLQDSVLKVQAISQQHEQRLALDMQQRQEGPSGRGGPSMG